MPIPSACSLQVCKQYQWLTNANLSHPVYKKPGSYEYFSQPIHIFIAMTGVLFSGLWISKDVLSLVGIQINAGQAWKSIHSLTADASVILLGLHFALHWNWLVTNVGRYIVNPIRGMFRQPGPRAMTVQTVRIKQHK
jgi:hypothetical protein